MLEQSSKCDKTDAVITMVEFNEKFDHTAYNLTVHTLGH